MSLLRFLIFVYGIVLTAFGIDALYLVFNQSNRAIMIFHGLHFIIVFWGFWVAYEFYKRHKHLLKI